MARRELERVLGRVYSQPLAPFVLSGYRRDWSASENGVAYLNLTAVPRVPAQLDSSPKSIRATCLD